MKAAKWREMSDEELEQKARELGEELFNLRFQLSMGVAKNPARVAIARRDLARARTILRERALRIHPVLRQNPFQFGQERGRLCFAVAQETQSPFVLDPQSKPA